MRKKWLRILGILCSLPLLYVLFIFGAAALRYLVLSKEIQERISYLKTTLNPNQRLTSIKRSLYFETPLALIKEETSPCKIYDRNGRIIGEFSHPRVEHVRDVQQLPSYFKKALLVMEDRHFYEHGGYHVKSILRAARANLRAGRIIQGGSTITQQLSKILFTTRKKQISRKLFELFCAIKMEREFTKNQIILLYVNTVHFGHGTSGLSQISQMFFKKRAKYLNALECAHLVALLANPTLYSPFLHPVRSKSRHWIVLKQLAKRGGISIQYAQKAFGPYWKQFEQDRDFGFNYWPMKINRAPYFIESIRRKLSQSFSREEILEEGLRVHTSLDLDFDRIAAKVLNHHLSKLTKELGEDLQGSLFALDNKTGEIVSALGGSGFSLKNQLLRFEQSSRPVGSLAKPLIYLLAFEKKAYTPDHLIVDEPLEIRTPQGWWRPRNYDRSFEGEMTLSEALLTSRNIPAVKLLQEIGVASYRDYILEALFPHRPTIYADLSIALGSFGLTPLEAACLFARFARAGEVIAPVFIQTIKDHAQSFYLDRREKIKRNRMKADHTSTLPYHYLYQELQNVLRDERGTAYKAQRAEPLGMIKAAGKTGTTQNRRDAWFVGYTPQITCAVWIGFDDNRAMLRGSGGSLSAPIWLDYIKQIYRFLPIEAMKAPLIKEKEEEEEDFMEWMDFEIQTNQLISNEQDPFMFPADRRP